jgi:fibrillarin-like rRNA methylase
MIVAGSNFIKWVDSKPYTRNLIPGESTCWEVHRNLNGIEHRYWDPNRSKLAAFLMCRGKTFPFELKSTTLYLGAASGTTVSHISDICPEGRIFAVEVAKNPFRELLAIAEKRGNIIPILEARQAPGNLPPRRGPGRDNVPGHIAEEPDRDISSECPYAEARRNRLPHGQSQMH